MMQSELLRESEEWEKKYPAERYYEPNFPVVSAAKCAEIEKVCDELSGIIADSFDKARKQFESAFEGSGLPDKGWTFDDVSQCLYARIQRNARRMLEERGSVQSPKPHRNGVSWSFWAQQLGDETTE